MKRLIVVLVVAALILLIGSFLILDPPVLSLLSQIFSP